MWNKSSYWIQLLQQISTQIKISHDGCKKKASSGNDAVKVLEEFIILEFCVEYSNNCAIMNVYSKGYIIQKVNNYVKCNKAKYEYGNDVYDLANWRTM